MTELCPCGSDKSFSLCCENHINQTQLPLTAEQLMRSRYSAYVLKNSKYIAQTYASIKQAENSIDDIKEWAEQTTWLSLEVVSTDYSDNRYHFVEFVAKYLVENEVWQMHEKSRFVQEQETWRYLDGDVRAHKLIKKVSRNEDCPCLSKRKFKRCCMRN
ncbi:YchJ family protein [Thalassotalea psychrophila]|uniref:YchJ family protein n=1 Tax=Thalassotalea psychrophila TaxID=3065647 RepID=A0ABY9TYY6_9GAMM|nr:YchJ family protein [Colwelliaceae bacterium SQ149]